MKWLAVDYGDSRTGLAGCDAGETITSPITPQIEEKSMNKVATAVTEVFTARSAQGLVCGLPRNMDGTEGSRANKSRRFAQRLANTAGVPAPDFVGRAPHDRFRRRNSGGQRHLRRQAEGTAGLGFRRGHSGELSELAQPSPRRGAAGAGAPRAIKKENCYAER